MSREATATWKCAGCGTSNTEKWGEPAEDCRGCGGSWFNKVVYTAEQAAKIDEAEMRREEKAAAEGRRPLGELYPWIKPSNKSPGWGLWR